MKNIFFILIACLVVTSVQAMPNMQPSQPSKRDVMVGIYTQYKRNADMGEKFLSAVKNGDIEAISQLETVAENASYLTAKDKFGNNAFHLAKDVYTVQAVARSIRHWHTPADAADLILTLKNETNDSGVIPAVQAVFDLRPANFFILIEKSNLEQDMEDVKKLNKGGALTMVVTTKQPNVVAQVQLAEGFTAAGFARMNQNVEGMDKVVAYFTEHAPYL